MPASEKPERGDEGGVITITRAAIITGIGLIIVLTITTRATITRPLTILISIRDSTTGFRSFTAAQDSDSGSGPGIDGESYFDFLNASTTAGSTGGNKE